jgi:septal ring factor EnvC (AmiA/AmiB activator)
LQIQQEAVKLKSQVQESWDIERRRLIDSLAKKEADIDQYLKELDTKTDQLTNFKRELSHHEKQARKYKEEKQKLEREVMKVIVCI